MINSEHTLSRRAVLGSAGRFAVAAPFLTLLGCSEPPKAEAGVSFSGATMGTGYRVTIVGDRNIFRPEPLKAGVERILETVNSQMSTYRPDSELSKFNASAQTSWTEVSPDTAHVMAKALDLSRISDGAFDATVAPLVNLWGFGPEKLTVTSPGDDRIATALRGVGHHHLGARTSPNAIKKTRPDLHVDLSGIGKGFAVDKVAEYLATTGVEHFLVDIGGDMRAHRGSPDRAAWRIGVERPTFGPRTVHRVITVGLGAVATSGDYRNFLEADGHLYSHIIDPRTGSPVDNSLASVTVIAPTTEEADGWSTALMVLGFDGGFELAERRGIPAFFITRTESGLVDRPSSEFRRFLAG